MISPQKNEKMRVKVLSKMPSEDAKKQLMEDPHNPDLWYIYAIALGNEGKHEESVDAFSEALVINPFDSDLYFGRGRKHNHCGRFWAALADLTMSIRLESDVWTHWYYRATTYNLNGYFQESIADFHQCIQTAEDFERCPMVYWLYTTYILELDDKEKALEALKLVSDDVVPPQMDYGYHRSVSLFKGQLSPEEFINIPDMEQHCLDQPNRVNLELNGMYYGLYAFHTLHGQPEKAKAALENLVKVAVPNTFGWLRGEPVARKMGLIK